VAIGLHLIGKENVRDLVDPEDVVGGHVAHIPVQGWQYPYRFIYLATLDNFPQGTVGLRPDDEQNVHQARYRHVVLGQVRDHRTVYVANSLVLKNRWGGDPVSVRLRPSAPLTLGPKKFVTNS